jgi:hypothetical protein
MVADAAHVLVAVEELALKAHRVLQALKVFKEPKEQEPRVFKVQQERVLKAFKVLVVLKGRLVLVPREHKELQVLELKVYRVRRVFRAVEQVFRILRMQLLGLR